MRKGIDLSYANKVTDWQKVEEAVDFVILRAGYGKNNIDQNLVPYATACIKHKILLWLYWFSYAYTVEMARNEARYCIEQAKKYGIKGRIAFDLEYDSVRYAQSKGINVTPDLVMAMTVAFCQEVEKAGYTPVVYTNKDYANRYFDIAQLKALKYEIWYAYYNKEIDRNDVALWQYTSKGSVPGIIGNVDMNYLLAENEEEISGWHQDSSGRWTYTENGKLVKDDWRQIDGKWYRFDVAGWMQTGWLEEKGKHYYLNNGITDAVPGGAMLSDIVVTIPDEEFGNEIYAFAEDGHMLKTNPLSIRGELI